MAPVTPAGGFIQPVRCVSEARAPEKAWGPPACSSSPLRGHLAHRPGNEQLRGWDGHREPGAPEGSGGLRGNHCGAFGLKVTGSKEEG